MTADTGPRALTEAQRLAGFTVCASNMQQPLSNVNTSASCASQQLAWGSYHPEPGLDDPKQPNSGATQRCARQTSFEVGARLPYLQWRHFADQGPRAPSGHFPFPLVAWHCQALLPIEQEL